MSDSVYMDTCVFLAWLKNEAGRVDIIAQLFDDAHLGNIKVLTSTLTIAEVLNLQGAKSPIPVNQREAVRGLFRNEWIVPKGLSRKVAELSQELVWAHGVKPKDGVHVATALIWGVEQLYTYDTDLLDLKSVATSFGRVVITEPLPPAQMTMNLQ